MTKIKIKMKGDGVENCKFCKWLTFYDWYRCACPKEGSYEEEFIHDVEKTVCPNFEKREGKIWDNGEF